MIKNIKKNKNKYFVQLGILIAYIVLFDLPTLKIPISWSNPLVGIKIHTVQIPFDYDQSYFTRKTCGRRCGIVNFQYEKQKQKVTITISEDVSNMRKKYLQNKYRVTNTPYYYFEKNNQKFIFYIVDVDKDKDLEVFIKSNDASLVTKDVLINMANSLDFTFR